MSFFLYKPLDNPIPILFSSPHSGKEVPPEVKSLLNEQFLGYFPDTDFDVDKLYDFAPKMGAHFLCAKYCRCVIDLNRGPKDVPLYSDGRKTTGLYPQQTFTGEAIFKNPLCDELKNSILKDYYLPYHNKLADTLEVIHSKFGVALLIECHSIKRHVPSIHSEKLPDIIIGTADGTSLPEDMTALTSKIFQTEGFVTALNHPFKGGFITRHYKNLERKIFSLQIEMSKDIYLNDKTDKIDEKKSKRIKDTLIKLTENLAKLLSKPGEITC